MRRRLVVAIALLALPSGCGGNAPAGPASGPPSIPSSATAPASTPPAPPSPVTSSPAGPLPLGIKDVVLTVGSDDTSRTVSWLATSDAAACVRLSGAAGTQIVVRSVPQPAAPPGVVQVHAALTGLAASTTYRYAVGDCAATWTPEASFATPGPGPFEFLFYGDPQMEATAAFWPETLRRSTQRHPDAALLALAGDLVDATTPAEQLPQWDLFLAPPELASIAVVPTLGNHDDAGGANYAAHFATPGGSDAGVTVPGSGDYAFVRGDALFLDLNTNSLDIAAHARFLDGAISAHPQARWRIALFHQAPFSGGGHSLDANVITLREKLSPVLSRSGVELVLNGHDHHYARSLLMNGAQPVPGTDGPALKPGPGQVLYITGNSASGTKFYPLAIKQPWLARSVQQLVPTYTVVQVSDPALTVTTYNSADAAVVDAITLTK